MTEKTGVDRPTSGISRQVASALALALALTLAGSGWALAQDPEASAEAVTTPPDAVTTPPAPLLSDRLDQIDARRSEERVLLEGLAGSTGEERSIAVDRLAKHRTSLRAELDEIVGELGERGAETEPELRARVESLLSEEQQAIREEIDTLEAELQPLLARRSEVDASEAFDLESEIALKRERLARSYAEISANADRLAELGVDVTALRAELESAIGERARDLADRLQLTRERWERERARVEQGGSDAEARQAVDRRFKVRKDALAQSLKSALVLMEERGLSTDELQTVLVQATGDITGDVLRPDVAIGLLAGLWTRAQERVLKEGPAVGFKILLVGQPTRGVDIGAIEFIHSQIIRLKEQGAAILLVSVELDEILALSDRIMVMNAGRIVGTVPREGATRQQLGLMMAGEAAA